MPACHATIWRVLEAYQSTRIVVLGDEAATTTCKEQDSVWSDARVLNDLNKSGSAGAFLRQLLPPIGWRGSYADVSRSS